MVRPPIEYIPESATIVPYFPFFGPPLVPKGTDPEPWSFCLADDLGGIHGLTLRDYRMCFVLASVEWSRFRAVVGHELLHVMRRHNGVRVARARSEEAIVRDQEIGFWPVLRSIGVRLPRLNDECRAFRRLCLRRAARSG